MKERRERSESKKKGGERGSSCESRKRREIEKERERERKGERRKEVILKFEFLRNENEWRIFKEIRGLK